MSKLFESTEINGMNLNNRIVRSALEIQDIVETFGNFFGIIPHHVQKPVIFLHKSPKINFSKKS